MVEFDSRDMDFNNFLKATSYIQEFTRRLLERSTKRVVKIPENLSSVNQLTGLVKQFLAEQQELALKVEKVHENQRTFNNLIKERLDKCKCEMELSVKSMLSKEINLDDLKRDDGSNYQEFTLKIPTTAAFPVYLDPSITLGVEAQQQIDLELMKMMESVSCPFPAEVHTPEENGAIRLHKDSFDSQFFESPDKRKPSFNKSARKRPAQHESPMGPYQCRDCDKTFRQKHGLSQHLLTHESHGAFECDGCGKRYSRQESVYRHQRSTQCNKYQTLTNVRHEDPHASMHQEIKVSSLMQPRAFLL